MLADLCTNDFIPNWNKLELKTSKFKFENRKDHFCPNLGHKIFFGNFSPTRCDLVQHQGKLMMQPCENCKNLNFGSFTCNSN